MCDRSNTNCSKWDAVKSLFGREDVIPMWVADMDFPVAKPIVEALKKRAEHEFYGYTMPGPVLSEAVVDRMERKFNWKIEPEWVVFTPGVVPALGVAVRSVTHPGDRSSYSSLFIILSFRVVTNSGCQIVNNG